MLNSIGISALPTAPTAAHAGGPRSRPGPDATAAEPIPATGGAGGSAAKAIRDQQREQADQAARQAAAAAERSEAKAPPPPEPFLQRRVGLVDGTFDVFIDLVSQPPPEIVTVRLFGPPADAPEPKPEAPAPLPSPALSAYGARAAGARPSLAVLA